MKYSKRGHCAYFEQLAVGIVLHDPKHAHSKATIGRESCRYSENYLDNWANDKEGTRLKVLARANQLELNAVTCRRNNACAVTARCECCDENTAESRYHFIMECSAYAQLRRCMLNKTMEALTQARDRRGRELNGLGPDDFEDMDDWSKMEVIVGKRLDSVATENKVDGAFRKYLKRAWKVRERLIQERWGS